MLLDQHGSLGRKIQLQPWKEYIFFPTFSQTIKTVQTFPFLPTSSAASPYPVPCMGRAAAVELTRVPRVSARMTTQSWSHEDRNGACAPCTQAARTDIPNLLTTFMPPTMVAHFYLWTTPPPARRSLLLMSLESQTPHSAAPGGKRPISKLGTAAELRLRGPGHPTCILLRDGHPRLDPLLFFFSRGTRRRFIFTHAHTSNYYKIGKPPRQPWPCPRLFRPNFPGLLILSTRRREAPGPLSPFSRRLSEDIGPPPTTLEIHVQ